MRRLDDEEIKWWGDYMMKEVNDEGTIWWEINMMKGLHDEGTIWWKNHMIRGLYAEKATWWVNKMMRGLHERRLYCKGTSCSIYHSTSPWERTLSFRVGALQVSWPTLRVSAPRRLSRHQVHFSRGKTIVDHHFALGHHPALIYPRWPSLWPLGKYSPIFDLVFLLETSGWKPRYFLEFADQSKLNLVSSVSFVSLFLIYSISTNVNRWILFL